MDLKVFVVLINSLFCKQDSFHLYMGKDFPEKPFTQHDFNHLLMDSISLSLDGMLLREAEGALLEVEEQGEEAGDGESVRL